jgi:hypothetical protein
VTKRRTAGLQLGAGLVAAGLCAFGVRGMYAQGFQQPAAPAPIPIHKSDDATLALPLIALADNDRGTVDAIGMLNYHHHGRLRVGDWVRYHVHGKSERGMTTDYTMTMVVGGEELWWGEPCFWIETQLSYFGQEPSFAASLLSYAVFEDSLPAVRFTRYIRKYIDELDASGKPAQQLFRRAPYELTQRGWEEYQGPVKRDTAGVEKVVVPKGTFDALRENRHYRTFVTEHKPDSSTYFEKTKDHTYWTSDDFVDFGEKLNLQQVSSIRIS